MPHPSAFRFVDLFAGIGGFHHALAAPEFNGECVLAVEMDRQCENVYRSAFPGTQFESDIRSLTRTSPTGEAPALPLDEVARRIPDHDVLCAGFPCQPFSKSGFQMGTRDSTRGTLFFDVMTVVLAKRPRFVILENVRNLAGPRHRDTWATIISSLREAGYRVSSVPAVMTPHLLPEAAGGAPQVRDRVFILARLIDDSSESLEGPPLVERAPFDDWNPDSWRIADYLDADDQIPNLDEFRLRPEEVGWIEAWGAFVQEMESDWLPGFPIWLDAFVSRPNVPSDCPEWKETFLRKNSDYYRENRAAINRWRRLRWGPLRQRVDDFPASRRKFEWQARKWQPRRRDRDLGGLVLHMRPSGIRVKPPTYLPALVAITQTSIIGPKVRQAGDGFRRITPREAARLQGLPDDLFDGGSAPDSAAYKQLGNAVNVGVVQYVASVLFADGGEDWGSSATFGLTATAV